MSPEPDFFINKLRAGLTERIVKEDIVPAQEQATKAVSRRNLEDARNIQENIEGIISENAEFNQKVDDLLEFIESHPRYKKDLSIPEYLKSRTVEEVHDTTETEHPFYDPEITSGPVDYDTEGSTAPFETENFPWAQSIFRLVQKDNKGKFVYPDIKTVTNSLLPEEFQDNQAAVNWATKRISTRSGNIVTSLLNSDAQTMREFSSKRHELFGGKNREEWKQVWEYIAEEYADYNLEQFVTDVLYRASRPAIVENLKQKFEEKRQAALRNIYIPDARAIALTLLIERDSKGNLVNGIHDIEKSILREDLRKNKEAARKAYINIANAKWTIKSAVANNPQSSMNEFITSIFGENLEQAKNEAWRGFYEKVLAEYPEMAPQEFVDKILYRGENGKSSTQEIDIQGKVYDQLKETNLKDIGPVHEITLYNALTREGVVEKIENLLEKPIEEALEEGGWEKEGSWNKCLQVSAETAVRRRAKERDGQPIGSKESKQARVFIENFIRDLAEDREKYEKVMALQGLHGFKFMYCIVPGLPEDKVQRLIDIFFPSRQYKIAPDGIVL